METWELVAREHIRDTLARYNWAGDAFRLGELAEAFCLDGVLEIRGGRRCRAATRSSSSSAGAPRPTTTPPGGGEGGGGHVGRHPDRAPQRDEPPLRRADPHAGAGRRYFTVLTELGLDHYGRYRDELVPVGDEWLISHRFVSTDWASPDSTMARSFLQ